MTLMQRRRALMGASGGGVVDTAPIITDTGKYLTSDGTFGTNQNWSVTDFYESHFESLPYTLVISAGAVDNNKCIVTYNAQKEKTNSYSVSPNPRELVWRSVNPYPLFRMSLYGDGSSGYAYVKETGIVIFAGANTPYYGKTNINE